MTAFGKAVTTRKIDICQLKSTNLVTAKSILRNLKLVMVKEILIKIIFLNLQYLSNSLLSQKYSIFQISSKSCTTDGS